MMQGTKWCAMLPECNNSFVHFYSSLSAMSTTHIGKHCCGDVVVTLFPLVSYLRLECFVILIVVSCYSHYGMLFAFSSSFLA